MTAGSVCNYRNTQICTGTVDHTALIMYFLPHKVVVFCFFLLCQCIQNNWLQKSSYPLKYTQDHIMLNTQITFPTCLPVRGLPLRLLLIPLLATQVTGIYGDCGFNFLLSNFHPIKENFEELLRLLVLSQPAKERMLQKSGDLHR